MEGKPRILIIDEHPLFVDALRRTIVTIDGAIAFSCSPGDDLEALKWANVDVIVCDPTVNGRFDSHYVAVLRHRFPDSRLMLLTTHVESSAVLGAIANGAQSFMLKSEPVETLRCAIELVCRGGIAFSLPVAAQLASGRIECSVEPSLLTPAVRGLSPREVQVIELVARGYSDSEIGTQLKISPRTAQQHVRNVLSKLDCRSRSEAVARVVGGEPRLVHANHDGQAREQHTTV